jgi:CRP-like cAMP-binding protein
VSPIFTRLAELWGILEEYFREMDSLKEGPRGSGTNLEDTVRRRTAKVEKAREETRRRRVVDRFHDAAASIQDELLMLDDVFKVRT